MKWFFAFNQMSEQGYGDFVRVAVASARRNTTLEACCLYDGKPSELTRWMEEQGVTVLPTRFRFAKQWEEFLTRTDNPGHIRLALGAFLRFEIPDVMQAQGMNEESALYTDCDVMFESDPTPILEPLRPRFFAVTPETFKNNHLHMNSGVMLMNVARLRAENERFMAFALGRINPKYAWCLDQEIYRAYYNPMHRLAWKLHIPNRYFYAVMSRLPLKSWQWDKLPLELNWKPYWGENEQAVIIHFHGLKPTQREALKKGELPEYTAKMHNPFWEKCVEEWDGWLEKVKGS